MYLRALLFILAASWLYLAVLLWRIDRLWYLRRVIICVVMGAVTGACLILEKWSPNIVMLLGLAFMLLGLYPAYIERRALDSLMGRRGGIPGTLKFFLLGISWDKAYRALRALEKTLVEDGNIGVQTEQLKKALPPDVSPLVRSRMAGPLILNFINSRRWNDARTVFESLFPNRDEAGASILLLMARPYAELGRLDDGYACLSAARVQGLPAELRMEWFLAATALLAFAGKGQALDEFFARHTDIIAHLPAPFAPYWRAIADLAAGWFDRARRRFDEALTLAGGEMLWAEAVNRRQAHAEDIHQAAMEGLNDAMAADVLTLRAEPEDNARRLAAMFGRGPAPWTLALIIVNIVVWLIMLPPTLGARGEEMMRALILYGANVAALVSEGGEYWRLVSSMFIHVGILHLLVNCYACYLFGTFVERFCNGRQMFVVYMISGICGSLASAYLGGYDASAGASGAIMGLLGAAIILQLRYRRMMPKNVRNLYVANFIFMAVLTIIFGVIEPQVDNYAHTGGLVAGMLGALGLLRCESDGKNEGRLRRWAVNSLMIVFMVMLVLTAWKAAHNVLAGGYPNNEPRMYRYSDPEQGVAFDAPRFWRHTPVEGANGYSLLDPVGRAALTISLQPVEEPAAEDDILELAENMWMDQITDRDRPAGALEKPSRIELGGRVMYRISYTRAYSLFDSHRDVRHDIYITEVGGRPYVIKFECLRWDHADYLPLLRRILASLRVEGE